MSKKLMGDFCPIPFLQLQLNPLGNVSACCFSEEYKVGDVKTQKIEEIWNGPIMQEWRKEFMSGDIKICKKAMKSFECHKMYHHLNHLVELKPIQSKAPQRLDLRLNGKCNLECIMCDVWRQPNGLYDESDFWTWGPEHVFPHLVEVDMLGGEPFIQKDTFRFIEEVAKVNQTCRWGFITNCSYNFNKKLESHLDKIKLRHIHMSLDSLVPETYAKIRKNGDLKKTMSTVMSFVEYRKKRRTQGEDFVLFASFCIQNSNWMEIVDFLDFAEKYEIQPILQSVIGREALSLENLSLKELQSIIDLLEPLMQGPRRLFVIPVYTEVERILKAKAHEKIG